MAIKSSVVSIITKPPHKISTSGFLCKQSYDSLEKANRLPYIVALNYYIKHMFENQGMNNN